MDGEEEKEGEEGGKASVSDLTQVLQKEAERGKRRGVGGGGGQKNQMGRKGNLCVRLCRLRSIGMSGKIGRNGAQKCPSFSHIPHERRDEKIFDRSFFLCSIVVIFPHLHCSLFCLIFIAVSVCSYMREYQSVGSAPKRISHGRFLGGE